MLCIWERKGKTNYFIGDKMGQIAENKVECLKCNTVVQSFTDSPIACDCGHVKIGGGQTNLLRYNLIEGVDYKELSNFLLLES